MIGSNRQLQRASTVPGSNSSGGSGSSKLGPLPLRQLSVRRAIPMASSSTITTATAPALKGFSLNLDMSSLRTPPHSSPARSMSTPNATAAMGPPQTPLALTASIQPGRPAISTSAIVAPLGDAALARRAARTYRNGPQLIMPYLYLGGEDNVDSEQLQTRGIRRVLNVAREVTSDTQQQQQRRYHQPIGIEYQHKQWDHNEPNLETHFDQCFEFIDGARTRHQGVLVHCQLGVSRSASLVIAYVMRTMSMSFDAAYEYVRLRAPCICPNLSLIAQLSAYGRSLAEREVPELCVSASSSENASPMELSQDEQPLVIAPPIQISTSVADNKPGADSDSSIPALGLIFSL